MSTVRIPPTLRASTGGAKLVRSRAGPSARWSTGWSPTHPALAAQLIAPDGDLNRFVNAFLNDIDIRHLQALDTPVARRRHAGPPAGDGRRLTAVGIADI